MLRFKRKKATALQGLRDELALLLGDLPEGADVARGRVRALLDEIDSKRGLFRPITPALSERIRDDLTGLKGFLEGLIPLRACARQLAEAEPGLQGTIDSLRHDAAREWLIRRSRGRRAFAESAGLDQYAADALVPVARRLEALRAQQTLDRGVALRLDEAEQLLAALARSPRRTGALAERLPVIIDALIERDAERPDPGLTNELMDLLEPLRALVRRDPPSGLQELGRTLQRMEAWHRLLERALGKESVQAESNRLQEIHKRYFPFRSDWRYQEDTLLRPLCTDAAELENALVQRAKAMRNDLLAQLGRLTGFVAELASDATTAEDAPRWQQLLGAPPEDPGRLEQWVGSVRQALDQCLGALATSRQAIETDYDAGLADIERVLRTLAVIPLCPADNQQRLELDSDRKRYAGLREPALDDLLTALEGLRATRDAAQGLLDAASTRLHECSSRVEAAGKQASMLLVLCQIVPWHEGARSDRSGPPDGGSATAVTTSREQGCNRILSGLEQLEAELTPPASSRDDVRRGQGPPPALEPLTETLDALVEDLERLTRELLDGFWTATDGDRTLISSAARLLDGDLEPKHPALPEDHPDLSGALALARELPKWLDETRCALTEQFQRLGQRRELLLAETSEPGLGPSAETASLAESRRALAAWEPGPDDDPLGDLEALRQLLGAVERQRDRLAELRTRISELRTTIGARLRRLQHELADLENDRPLIDGQRGLRGRIWALAQALPEHLVVDEALVLEQLRSAEHWLRALEVQSNACAAIRVARQLEALELTDAARADTLRRRLEALQGELPGYELRREIAIAARQSTSR